MIVNKKIPKNPLLFCCESCDYNTCNKKDYQKHLQTKKHKMGENQCLAILDCQKSPYELSSKLFDCECGKSYTSYSGLWRHKRKCACTNENQTHFSSQQEEESISNDLVVELIKQNKEFQHIIVEQSKHIMHMAHHSTTNSHNTNIQDTNININNNNSHNKFNLNVFLNETCKDAMNINEFVDSVKISLKDIENVGSLGYVEGISKIILNNLNQLEVTKRPIHCSDAKREIIHIKENNVWEREGETKPKLTNTIKHIAHKNVLSLRDWKAANPDYRDSECKKNDVYMRIVNESMGACDKELDEKNYQRIIHNIAKETHIAKPSNIE